MAGGGLYQQGPGNPSKILLSGPAAYGGQPFGMTAIDSEGVALQKGQQAFQRSVQNPFDAAQKQADRDLQTRLQGNQLGYEGQQAAWNRDFQAQQQQSSQGFQGQQADAQRGFQGQQNAAERANQLSIASMPWDFKRQVFGTVSPLLQGLIGGAGTPGGAGAFSQGGPVPPPPGASHEEVWSPDQVQQQVNSQRSQSAQQAGTQQRENARSTAARGFGSNSPLLAALNGQVDSSRMEGDAQAALDTRLNASKLNADQGIARDKVNSANYAAQVDAQSRQRQANLNYTSSLVAALAGMV